jgi:hypothetical protein
VKLLLIKIINILLEVLIWFASKFDRRGCEHSVNCFVFEERRTWRNPWVRKMVPVCLVCKDELEQQRLASGGW